MTAINHVHQKPVYVASGRPYCVCDQVAHVGQIVIWDGGIPDSSSRTTVYRITDVEPARETVSPVTNATIVTRKCWLAEVYQTPTQAEMTLFAGGAK